MTQKDLDTVRHFQLDCTHPTLHWRPRSGQEVWCELCGAIGQLPPPDMPDHVTWQRPNASMWTPPSDLPSVPITRLTHPSAEERLHQASQTLALLRAMIQSGEQLGHVSTSQYETAQRNLRTLIDELAQPVPPLPQVNEGEIVQNRGLGESYICVGHGLRGDPIVVKMVSMTNPDEWATIVPVRRTQR